MASGLGAFLSAESTSDLRHLSAMACYSPGRQFLLPEADNRQATTSSMRATYRAAAIDDDVPLAMLDAPGLEPIQQEFQVSYDLDDWQIQHQQQQQQQQRYQERLQGQHGALEDAHQSLTSDGPQHRHLPAGYQFKQEQGQNHADPLSDSNITRFTEEGAAFNSQGSRGVDARLHNLAPVNSSALPYWPMNRSASPPSNPTSSTPALEPRSTGLMTPALDQGVAHEGHAEGMSRPSSSLSGRAATSRTCQQRSVYSSHQKSQNGDVWNPFPTPASSPPPMMMSYEQKDLHPDLKQIEIESKPMDQPDRDGPVWLTSMQLKIRGVKHQI